MHTKAVFGHTDCKSVIKSIIIGKDWKPKNYTQAYAAYGVCANARHFPLTGYKPLASIKLNAPFATLGA